ncbi:hypothetical protein G7046_g7184 [Stylonectria norvegica]|nr:hypothetical protein G7046_g7184 [Stylonectria norvegica]
MGLEILDFAFGWIFHSTRQARSFDSNSRWVPELLPTSTASVTIENQGDPMSETPASRQLHRSETFFDTTALKVDVQDCYSGLSRLQHPIHKADRISKTAYYRPLYWFQRKGPTSVLRPEDLINYSWHASSCAPNGDWSALPTGPSAWARRLSSNFSAGISQPKTIELIVEAGKKAFDPNTDAASRETGVKAFTELIDETATWVLLPALNTIIKPGVLPAWLRDPLMQTLTRVPLRPDGVRGTMEFVFSVHPSNSGTNSGAASSQPPQKQGASITQEAVAVATRLLSSVPSSMTPEAWFDGISDQLFRLMSGEGGPDIARTAAQIVGYGILGRKQFGAPGTPGWKAFVQPLLQDLNPSLKPDLDLEKSANKEEKDEVVNLSKDHVLVNSQSLKTSLQRLNVLLLSNPSSGLTKRVLQPVLLQLWALASWVKALPATEEHFCKPARSLLQTYLRLFGNAENLMPFVENMLCIGSPEGAVRPWKYRLTGKAEVEVVEPRALESTKRVDLNWNEIEDKAAALVDTMCLACSTEEVSSVFLTLLRRWIQSAGKQDEVIIEVHVPDSNVGSQIQELLEVTILQKLMEKSPEKLVSHFDQLLELVCQVLKADGQSPLGDDLVAVVLSLLNLVITAPTFRKSHINGEQLKIVESSLDRLSKEDRAQVSPTAKNLALLLRYRDEVNPSDEPTSAPSTRQIEDRRTYNLAMNYITGGSDNPPPVVSEGLNLLSSLILAGSPILDVPTATALMSNLLVENEDYINLRVIKGFTQLANKHPKSVVQELLDHYLDAQEKSPTDVRLRFGEALLQVIERLGDTFTGDVAQQTSETLLSIAGRRGYRPKTMVKQAREEKLRKMKGKQAQDADEGETMDEDDEITEEEKANNDILAQIVQGWESKRGSEDVRMRASALSIFGIAVETNIGGIGPTLVSGSVDLCINILAMERELETAILRRAAILNVLSFVRALDKAKESGRTLGFGLTGESRDDIVRTLQYVAATDNDGLVQQHARDVIESLENWQMTTLLQQQSQTCGPEIMSLAGLHVNPGGTLVDASGRSRPRIEEVE